MRSLFDTTLYAVIVINYSCYRRLYFLFFYLLLPIIYGNKLIPICNSVLFIRYLVENSYKLKHLCYFVLLK